MNRMVRLIGDRHVRAVAVIYVSVLMACGAERDTGQAYAEVDSTSDVVAVMNTERGTWDDAQRWRVREQLRVGSQDGLLLTNELTGVTLGPTGRLFILDFASSDLVSVMGDGSGQRRVAGPGPGPRELEFPGGMGWDSGGRIWVADGRGAYTVFDSAGRFIKSAPRPIRGLMRRQFPLVFRDDQTLIDEAPGGHGVAFVAVDVVTGNADTLTSIDVTPAPDLPRIFLRPSYEKIRFVLAHYRPRTVWALGTDGTAWIARTDSLRLYKIELASGDTIRVVNTRHRDPELSREDLDLIRGGLAEAGLDPDVGVFNRPVIQSIHLTNDGYILVQIVETVGEDGKALDVFNPEGFFLGTVQMPFAIARQSQPSIVGDTLVAISLGPNDEPYVVRSTIQRTRDERGTGAHP